jgi:putative ABC transport system ATP-binding protein
MTTSVVELEGIGKNYKLGTQTVHALAEIDLTIEAGEMVAVLAPSGAGKTTLLNIIGALDRPTVGTAYCLGENVAGMSDREQAVFRRRKIGFVFQAFNLLPTLTAWENVCVPRLLNGDSYRSARSDALAMLERVGLGDRVGHRPSELSGGQIQRVSIARALIMNPRLVVADEPTGNLDSQSGADVIDLLSSIAAESGARRAVVVATHDLNVAQAATRWVRMRDGRVVSDETRDAGMRQ